MLRGSCATMQVCLPWSPVMTCRDARIAGSRYLPARPVLPLRVLPDIKQSFEISIVRQVAVAGIAHLCPETLQARNVSIRNRISRVPERLNPLFGRPASTGSSAVAQCRIPIVVDVKLARNAEARKALAQRHWFHIVAYSVCGGREPQSHGGRRRDHLGRADSDEWLNFKAVPGSAGGSRRGSPRQQTWPVTTENPDWIVLSGKSWYISRTEWGKAGSKDHLNSELGVRTERQ